MAQQNVSVTERASSTAGAMARRASEAGSEAWRGVRGGGIGAVAPLFIGAAVGIAAYAFLARGARRGRHPDARYEHLISVLNNLTAISHDGEYGFRTAAEAIQNQEIKQVFERAANRCAQGAAELQRKVRKLGGRPEEIGTVSGAAHRAWVNLKAAVSGRDDVAILNEVERGEDVAKAAYEKALAGHMPPDIREALQRQYNGVRQNHDKVRNFRNEARAKQA